MVLWKAGRAAVCLLACLLAFLYGSWAVRNKEGSTLPEAYGEARGTMDVLFIGSSHVYQGISPAYLWNRFGISSFDVGGAGQPLWISYAYLKEMCGVQTPRVVVVDMFSLPAYRDDYLDNSVNNRNNFRKNIQMIRSTPNKAAVIEDFIPRDERLSYYLDVIQYHSNIKNLNQKSFQPVFGYVMGNGVIVKRQPAEKITDTSQITQVGEISARHLETIDNMIALSKEKGFSLVFINVPYVLDSYGSPTAPRTVYNAMEILAADRGVPYLDYTKDGGTDCGIDWQTDTYDAGRHLNIYGAEKFTEVLGRYLSETYDLPDHRGDARYASWDDAYQQHQWMKAGFELAEITDAADYLQKLKDPDLIAVFSMRGKGIVGQEASVNTLSEMGLHVPYDTGESFLGVLQGGQPEFQKKGGGTLTYFSENLGTRIHAKSTGSSAQALTGETPGADIYVDGADSSKNREGLNIVVYSRYLDKVMDSCWIEAGTEPVVKR